MILEMARKYKNQHGLSILDVGTADGCMLPVLKDALRAKICLGIEPSKELINSGRNPQSLIQAMGENLPFKGESFDLITAVSVVDHLKEPGVFLKECRRVLKKEGVVIITLVAPFYDKLAVSLKIKDDDHIHHFTEKTIASFIKEEGFKVLQASRFALPFFGVIFERFIERFLNFIRSYWPMFYIIAVGKKEADINSKDI
jgi:ubiquinone/menaquinone biosynthesis C-methylase UbiE